MGHPEQFRCMEIPQGNNPPCLNVVEKRGVGFEGQHVAGDMFGMIAKGLVEITQPAALGLLGQTVNKIQTQVILLIQNLNYLKELQKK